MVPYRGFDLQGLPKPAQTPVRFDGSVMDAQDARWYEEDQPAKPAESSHTADPSTRSGIDSFSQPMPATSAAPIRQLVRMDSEQAFRRFMEEQ